MSLYFQGNVTVIMLVVDTLFARIIYVSTVKNMNLNNSLSQMVK